MCHADVILLWGSPGVLWGPHAGSNAEGAMLVSESWVSVQSLYNVGGCVDNAQLQVSAARLLELEQHQMRQLLSCY